MVQRFQVAFIREIWLPVRETGRFVLYPGDSRIIRESWHVCTLLVTHVSKIFYTLISCIPQKHEFHFTLTFNVSVQGCRKSPFPVVISQ